MRDFDHFKEFIHQEYPFWKDTLKNHPIKENLLFSQSIPLSNQVFQTCYLIIKAFWQLRQNPTYQKYVKEQSQMTYDPQHYSILMCYDFHITEAGVKLIEINTNASFAIVVGLLSHKNKDGLPLDLPTDNYNGHESLRHAIYEEMTRFGLNPRDHLNIAIMDNDPEKQKAYFEFHYYKSLFEHWGFKAIICDPSELQWDTSQKILKHRLGQKIHFIYNRCCDFLLERPSHQHLRQAFVSHSVCFSPNPYEYSLLAHKQRFIDLSNKNFLKTLNISEDCSQIIQETLPYSFSVLDLPKEQLWSQRKMFFFKPKMLYGGKGVFRGSSISKSKFESIYNKDFMAQKYIPPPVFAGYKYDLRIYTYKSEPYLAAARLYQGQVTNANTVGGGLASICWT